MTVTMPPIETIDLRQPNATLLLSCYELGHQPLNLASPLAALRQAGFAPDAVDTSIDELSDEAIDAASLVAISVPMHTALRLGARVAARVHARNPSCHICFYGLYATLNAEYLLENGANSVIGGEYEAALVGLAVALANGGDPATVPGIGTRNHPAAPVIERITLPSPARDLLPELRSYAGLATDGVIVQAGYVEATRGCHHTCTHCPITPVYGGRMFAIPRETVIADARVQIQAGARHITFGDPDFFNGPTHGLRIMKALRDEFPFLTFDATIKVEHVIEHADRIPELVANGCVFIVSAVESVSDFVLLKLDKGHTRADIVRAIAILDAAGLPMRPSLLPFTPWATLDDYLDLLRFFAERGLVDNVDPVHFSIRLLIPPGSAVLKDADASWLGELDPQAFTYRWVHPDPRVDALQREVAVIVERAASDNADSIKTFALLWDAAHRAAGITTPPLPLATATRKPPPRLTESWFC